MYVYVLIFLCGRSQVSFYPPTLLSIRVHPQIWSIFFQPSVWTLKTDDPQAGVIQRTIPIPFSSKYILLIKKRKLSWTLTHSFSMHPFSNPLQFSDVFKGGRGGGGERIGALGTNGLTIKISRKKTSTYSTKIICHFQPSWNNAYKIAWHFMKK